jgi:ASC-1-like (ASCH) protein
MHKIKLKEEFYNYILNGTKKIEIRLFDEKRSQIKLNDKIKYCQ